LILPYFYFTQSNKLIIAKIAIQLTTLTMESIRTQVTKGTKSSPDGVHTRFLDETEVTSPTPSLTPSSVANRRTAAELFSEDGSVANQELKSILRSDEFVIREHENEQPSGTHVYSSIRARSREAALFYIEDHNCASRCRAGLLTTPAPSDMRETLKGKYEEYTGDWDNFGGRGKRKQYDICGKRKEDVMNILNEFK